MRGPAAAALAAAACLAAGRARAAFEDSDISPRSAAMGGAFTAVAEGTAGLPYNPAGLAAQRDAEAGLGWANFRELPSGSADRDDISAAAAGPSPVGGGGWGALWRRAEENGVSTDQQETLGYGLRRLWERGDDRLDVGASASLLNRASVPTNSSLTKPAFGLGAILYLGTATRVGASLLNLNQPRTSLDGVSDQAPRALKLGFARQLPFWTLTGDLTERASSASGAGGFSAAAGLEHWWTRADLGAAALRTGLNLGARGELYSAGFGLQRGGAEISYAVQFPLSEGRISQLVALHYSFGGRQPQDDYQELLRKELQSRADLDKLVESQDEALAKLRQELLNARIEIEKLRVEIENKQPKADDASSQKLKWLLELQQQLQSEMNDAAERRGTIARKKEAPSGFAADWAAYDKLKAGGAPASVRAESLQHLIEKYRGTGTDLSDVYSEYLNAQSGL